ncbi:Fur family transcriptional regulator [Oceanibacterium hippocampi]|uniref:Zinc uptake regulation protein n=1 Tax=Oceanibacterium hippocampi TaxID=745714 RepID=A0A1Y5TFF2_9PROT|nr:transcriptional repressor [Oceanibacterium hippocampi]SLN59093.1 Zinc uptake regulation protein [Oceanibacterium hippocampi]
MPKRDDEAIETAFPDETHDHRACVRSSLAAAERICEARGRRLTAQRRQVLRIIADSHRAIGAYDILERMASSGRRPAPITVYRALDFLMENALVHRLASLNAFVACRGGGHEHGAQFLICAECGNVGELASDRVDRAIDAAAASASFRVVQPIIEVTGVCGDCNDGAPAEQGR